MSKIKGRVKWFNEQKGYGFIEREESGQKDVFLHQSALEAAGISVTDGDRLSFDIEAKAKGPSAINIQKL